MIERVEQHARAAERRLLLDAVHAGDARRLAGEKLRREVAERRDHLRANELDLAEEVRLAQLDLVGLGVAVSRRAALEDVRDVDLGPREADALEQAVEQLPGLADERDPLLVLVEAGSLADEHQVGFGVADSEHDLRAPLVEAAAGAGGCLAAELFEPGRDRVRNRVHRAGV